MEIGRASHDIWPSFSVFRTSSGIVPSRARNPKSVYVLKSGSSGFSSRGIGVDLGAVSNGIITANLTVFSSGGFSLFPQLFKFTWLLLPEMAGLQAPFVSALPVVGV